MLDEARLFVDVTKINETPTNTAKWDCKGILRAI